MSDTNTPVVLAVGNSIEDTVNREFLRHMVAKQITCAETGRILDVRDAVAVEIAETATGQCIKLLVTTAHAYDDDIAERAASCATVEGCTVTIYDGRVLFGGQA